MSNIRKKIYNNNESFKILETIINEKELEREKNNDKSYFIEITRKGSFDKSPQIKHSITEEVDIPELSC